MSDYHRLPIAQKQAEALTRARESALSCPVCDTQVMPVDLLVHLEQRCTGPRDPGPGAKWVSYREAIALGVHERTLKRWRRRGRVRFKGTRGDQQYLVRDLAMCIAQQKTGRRR